MASLRHVKFFFQHLPPYSGAGAPRGASIVSGFVTYGRERGLQLDYAVITTTPNAEPINGARIDCLSVGESENRMSLPVRFIREIAIGASAAFNMLRGMRRSDVIVISSPHFMPALVLGLTAMTLRYRYILDIRDLYPLVYAEAGVLSKKSWLYRTLARCAARLYRRAAAVIAATQGLADAITRDSGRTDVQCIYNGFPQSLVQVETRKRERFTACFHGILGYFQDIETLLAVARRLEPHDVDLIIVGYGKKQELLERDLPPNVRFLGRMTFQETIAQLSSCHVGLCLRYDDEISRDAFPVKVWECIGLGMPSIVTPRCEAGRFLELHGCGWQLDAGDVEGLAQLVLRLKEDPQLSRQIDANCAAVRGAHTREALGLQAARYCFDKLGAGGAGGSAP
jgi:glycosyltransferase involved in cell wall biosynthesis